MDCFTGHTCTCGRSNSRSAWMEQSPAESSSIRCLNPVMDAGGYRRFPLLQQCHFLYGAWLCCHSFISATLLGFGQWPSVHQSCRATKAFPGQTCKSGNLSLQQQQPFSLHLFLSRLKQKRHTGNRRCLSCKNNFLGLNTFTL